MVQQWTEQTCLELAFAKLSLGYAVKAKSHTPGFFLQRGAVLAFCVTRNPMKTCTLTSAQTYFSAAWSRTGRKGPYAHYYMQVQPNGGSFVGMCILSSYLRASRNTKCWGTIYGPPSNRQGHSFASMRIRDACMLNDRPHVIQKQAGILRDLFSRGRVSR
jgi:hypothetical protein